MLGVFRIPIPEFMNLTRRIEVKVVNNSFDAFLLGVILAMAFCPNTGVMYFGMLIPLTIITPAGCFCNYLSNYGSNICIFSCFYSK